MDYLSELFAHKPTSSIGEGLVASTDSLGNNVSSIEQEVVIVQRFSQADLSSRIDYAWTPSRASSTSVNFTAGSVSDGITTFTPTLTGISVSASDSVLQYIYLVCALSPTFTDGYVTGGTVTAVSITACSSLQTNTNTTGYILLCTWQAGSLVNRYRYWSIECQLNNSGVGNTVFNTWTAG